MVRCIKKDEYLLQPYIFRGLARNLSAALTALAIRQVCYFYLGIIKVETTSTFLYLKSGGKTMLTAKLM